MRASFFFAREAPARKGASFFLASELCEPALQLLALASSPPPPAAAAAAGSQEVGRKLVGRKGIKGS